MTLSRFVAATVVIALANGCGAEAPTLRPPATRAPVASTPSAGPTPQVGETDEGTCGHAEAVTTTPQPYLDEPPDPSTLRGATAGEEEELNEGEEPPTPINPDAIVTVDPNLPRADIPIPGAQDDPLPTDVVAYRLPFTVDVTSQIAEPNIAVSGSSTVMTWNWGFARSFDGGATALYLDPDLTMLGPDGQEVDGGYCCDQLVHYVPQYDLWIWVVQSNPPFERNQGGNRIRLWLAHGDEPFARYVDLRSSSVNVGVDAWFDQPKIGTSEGHLFLSVNAYGPKPETQEGQPEKVEPNYASLVFRLPLEALANSATMPLDCMTTLSQLDFSGSRYFGLVPVRRASSVMYLGAHHDNGTLAIWRWPDSDSQPTFHLAADMENGNLVGYPVPLERDEQGNPVVKDGRYLRDDFKCFPKDVTAGPTNWCLRSTERIATAWQNGGQIGFAWNVGQAPDPDPGKDRPFPFIWVLILDESRVTTCQSGGCVVAKPHFASTETAFQHPAIGPNSNGDLGMTFIYGGGAWKPACAAAVRDSATAADSNWDLGTMVTSDREAVYPTSGDYLNVWPGPSQGSWTGGCTTVQAANGFDWPGSVHYFHFGRRSNTPAN